MSRYLPRFLFGTVLVFGSLMWVSLHQVTSGAQQAQKPQAEKGKDKKGMDNGGPKPRPRPDDSDAHLQGKAKPKLNGDEIDRKKAAEIEQEILKHFPSPIAIPDVAKALLKPLKPVDPIWKPHVITVGDVDNFNYDPGKDKTNPCCISIKTRNFDEPGVNKPFAHRVQIPCCKIIALRCDVRVRVEGDYFVNDRLYIAIPGKPCTTVWHSDIAAINPSWISAKPGQVFNLTWWLPPGVIQQINKYIFESPGCDCHLCLLSQDDHAVDYWRLTIYCCPCPH